VFDKWKIPGWVKPPIAGIAIGLIGYFFPEVFGTGFPAIESALQGELAFWLLVALIFARIAATSLTLGSGFSGGVFAPALFVGAMLGGAYGELMHSLFPSITATSGAYATVGMAAVFAGAARAPVTAIIILFEMTLDYRIMLPLMFATVVATLLAARFEPESIYTLKLVRRGIDFMGQRAGRLHTMSVTEAMTPLSRAGVIEENMSVEDLRRYFHESGRRGAMALDPEGRLLGIVTLRDLERALVEDRGPEKVADILTTEVITAFADENLDEVVKQAGMLEVGYIPVVTRDRPRVPVGILVRSDIIRAYGSAISGRDRRRVSFERRRAEHVFGLRPVEVVLEVGDPAIGRRLGELNPPPETVIVSIIRADTVLVPRDETRLQAGDRVTALALGDSGAILGRLLKGGNYR
jgi:chloride channel protein, CIC family